MPNPYRVCFVCTGNICRSPMAEAVFRRYVDKAGLAGLVEVDSAGLGGWHVGENADRRALAVLRAQGYSCDHRARRFEVAWFDTRDLVVALDGGHLRRLRRLAPDEAAAGRIRLLRSFDPASAGSGGSRDSGGTDLDVPDPYYGSGAEFEHCLALVEAACLGLLDHVAAAVTGR
jgi:low molecular weight protein-tyrosine phosphatase